MEEEKLAASRLAFARLQGAFRRSLSIACPRPFLLAKSVRKPDSDAKVVGGREIPTEEAIVIALQRANPDVIRPRHVKAAPCGDCEFVTAAACVDARQPGQNADVRLNTPDAHSSLRASQK